MVTRLPATMGQFREQQLAEFQAQQTRNMELPRQSDARALLQALALVDRRFQQRSPEEALREERMTASRIAETPFTLQELTQGLKRAYSTAKTPWNPIGEIFDEVRAIRAERRKGSALRELQALPPVPPARGPVREAYGDAVDRECPQCGAAAGDPCINPKTGTYRRMHCLPRKRA